MSNLVHLSSRPLISHDVRINADTIVLDLDGTLVCSCSKDKGDGKESETLHLGRAMHALGTHVTFSDSHGDMDEVWVHKRPGFDKFLQTCFNIGKVGVWSMGQPGYVKSIVNLFPEKPEFVFDWCHCDRSSGRIFKRLSKIPIMSTNGSAIMIDDKKEILEECSNVYVILVPEWNPRQRDDHILYDLTETIISVKNV